MVTKGESLWGDKSGAWDAHTHITIYKIGNQQGPTVQDRELYSIFHENLFENLKKNEYMQVYN